MDEKERGEAYQRGLEKGLQEGLERGRQEALRSDVDRAHTRITVIEESHGRRLTALEKSQWLVLGMIIMIQVAPSVWEFINR